MDAAKQGSTLPRTSLDHPDAVARLLIALPEAVAAEQAAALAARSGEAAAARLSSCSHHLRYQPPNNCNRSWKT